MCIYGATLEENLKKVLSKQKKGIRIMLGMKKTESDEHLFAHSKFLQLTITTFLKQLDNVKQHNGDSYNYYLFETNHFYDTGSSHLR